MKIVPFFGSSLAALSPAASAQQRVNLFYDFHPDGDKSPALLRSRPGLTQFCQLPQSPIRGMITINSYMYIVADNGLYQVSGTGNFSLLGTFGNSGQNAPVEMAYNPTQLIIVDGTNGAYLYLWSDLVEAITIQVATIQNGLIDVTNLAQQYQSQSQSPGGGTPTVANPGILPRVTTPRVGGYRGGTQI